MTGKWDKRAGTGRLCRRLTRLRSAVLSLPLLLPASTLLRLVNPPTLLPMLLLKTPLLPELDMAASTCVWDVDAKEVEVKVDAERQSLECGSELSL